MYTESTVNERKDLSVATGIWLFFALPVMAALLGVYFTSAKRLPSLAAKGGATGAALATAVFCHLRGGGLPDGRIIIAAVCLFALADVLLDTKFLFGVAAFALGHIMLIFWIFAQESALHQSLFTILNIGLGVLLYALAVFLFRRSIRKAGKTAPALLLYAAVLSLMTAVAATLPYFGGVRYLPFALGAVLFMISDLFVAQGILIGMARKWHIFAMILYESAVMLMALLA